MKTTLAVLIGAIVCVDSMVQAGVVVALVPDNPGPYFGGESLNVDVWLNSDESSDFLLRGIRLDFSQTDSSFSLDPTFGFDFSAVPDAGGYTTVSGLPVPWTYMGLDCGCPTAYFPFPGGASLHIGTLGVELPTPPGTYRVDALNGSETDEALGARIDPYTPNLNPAGVWRAHTGEITVGTYDFTVIPEPATLSLLLLGGLGLLIRARRRNPSGFFSVRILVVLVSLGFPGVLMGRPTVVPAQKVVVSVDSGAASVTGQGSAPVLVFSHVVSHPAARWIRLHFAEVELSGSPSAGSESFLSITSLEDGAIQIVDSRALSAWGDTSACFNGSSVLLELFAYPGTGDNRVVVDQILAGLPSEPGGGGPTGQECLIDDRVPSDDPRAGRLFYFDEVFQSPATCTAFLFNERSNCLLTAGHCCARVDYGEFAPLVEFNVPLSEPDETINHPGPEDQYPVDPDSDQFLDGGTGNDWCYFGVFDNTATASSPLQAQRSSYRLADQAPAADSSTLRITGYGVAGGELYATQQTATGAYDLLDGTTLRYDVYTVPGTSGSPVKDECSGLLYGIHTHGGCRSDFDYMNFGTAIQHPGLQNALASPLGVCAEPQDCNGNGIDDACDVNCGPPGGPCDVPGCGLSGDCLSNGMPDECEPDCNGNGVADRCDINAGTSLDLNDDYIPDECQPVFVDQSATGANDGSSWADAYTDLQSALNDPDPCGRPNRDIWVAEGVYTPAACPTGCNAASPERGESFQLPDGAVLYGGFPAGGGDGTFQARSPASHPTILSGDLNADDGPGFANNDENSRAVVRVALSDSGLDGFHVVGGNANGTGDEAVGAGIWLNGDSTLFNCIVRGNSASNRGAGVLANWGNHTIVNCLFTGNVSTNSGAALFSSFPTSLTIRNCTLSGNSTSPGGSDNGAGIAYSGAVPAVRNCVLWGNDANGATGESAQIYPVGAGNPSIEYSCVQGWTGALGGPGNIGSDPLFVDADGSDDRYGTADDNGRLPQGSPAIDAGKNYSGVPETTDLDGNPRRVDDPLTDDTGSGTAPIVDMGAYEYYCGTNCDDGNDCTADVCSGETCSYTNVAPGTPCSDGIYCNGGDTCSGGTCSTHAGDPCSGGDLCCEATGTCAECCEDGDCDDGVFCNGAETCVAGVCVFPGSACDEPRPVCCEGRSTCASECCAAIDCDDGNVCTTNICSFGNGVTGKCRWADDNSMPCDDGVYCNGADSCRDGACTLHSGNPCTDPAAPCCSEAVPGCMAFRYSDTPAAPLPAPHPHDRRKNRYISFDPNKAQNDCINVAFKIVLTDITMGSCDDGTGAQGGNVDFCRTDRGVADCNACSGSGATCFSASVDCPPGESCDPTGAACVNDAPSYGGSNAALIRWVGLGSCTRDGFILRDERCRVDADCPKVCSVNGTQTCVNDADCGGGEWCVAQVCQDGPVCQGEECTSIAVMQPQAVAGWSPVVHVADCEIVPQAVYGIRAVNMDTGVASGQLVVETTQLPPAPPPAPYWWGDVVGALVSYCNGDIRESVCSTSGDCGGDPCERAWELPNGVVNIDDVTVALWTSAPDGSTVSADFTWVDLHGNDTFVPGSEAHDPPNFKINASDVQQVIFAFQGMPYKGYDPKDCPDVEARPDGPGELPGPGAPEFTLVAGDDLLDPTDDLVIEVFVSEATNVAGHELALEVTGGTAGTLTVTDISVDTTRTDYLYYDAAQAPLEMKQLPEKRLGAVVQSPGEAMTKTGPAYLATYTFQPAGGATGVFEINVRGQGKSFLLNPNGSTQVIRTSGAVVVAYGVDCLNAVHCDDNQECSIDTCTANNECQYAPVAAGTACDDGLWCTLSGSTCDGTGLCAGGEPRCRPGELCLESTHTCQPDLPPAPE